MTDFIDDFLKGLEEDKSKPRERENFLQKVLMSSRDSQGTIVFAPFMDTKIKKFYVPVNGVREYRTTLSKFHEGNDEVWVKILQKELYGELTEAQSKLYDEVVGLFDQVDEEMGDTPNKWETLRVRSYSLFQGVVINHLDPKGAKKQDLINKPALLVFPSKQPINELAEAIKNKMAAMNNSKEWIPAVFSPNATGRDGVLTISFTKPDKPGYDCSVGFEFNSTYAKIIDPAVGFPEEVVNEFGDMIFSFLGWQNGPNGRFSEENFKELKAHLESALKVSQAGAPKVEEVPENKNGIDPMLATPVASSVAPEAAPAPTEAPASKADDDTEVDLPF